MKYIFAALISYFICSLNPAYIIGKIKGFDVRKSGSGNAGGSNAVITMGGAIGAACIVFDILKSYFAVFIGGVLFGKTPLLFAVSAVFTVIGHCFPFYMGFKGGKGLACLGGAVLCFDPIVFLILLGIEAVIAFSSGYICLVSITAPYLFAIAFGILTKDIFAAAVLLVIAVIMTLKHIVNIKRIKDGTEMKLSYLFNKEKELEKIKKQ